jgi:hypothetical protein
MTGLQHLPNELLCKIAQCLSIDLDGSGNRSSHALYALLLCSHRFYHISQAPLYTNIALHNNSNILNLIRTLLYQPNLATLIQSLATDPDLFAWSTVSMEEELKCQVRKHMYYIYQSPEMVAQWLEDFQSNRKGASVAFLLLLLPELKNLVMCIDDPPDYVTTAMWSGSQVREPTSIGQAQLQFPQLSTLGLTTDTYVEIEFEPILRLASLSTLRVESLATSTWRIRPGVSLLHELELIHCQMSEEDVFPLLEACSELRKFTLRWDQPWADEDVRDEEWDFGINVAPWIIRGLQRSRATLEVLDLSGQQPIRHDTMSLGNLAVFDCLLNLRAPALMMINQDSSPSGRQSLHMLPTSLKKLHLIVGGVSRGKLLPSELLDCVQSETWGSTLEVLTITWQHTEPFHEETSEITTTVEYQLLKSACDKRGILLLSL